MADTEQIFLDPGPVPFERAVTLLATALDLQKTRSRDDVALSGEVDGVAVFGTLEPNIYADPAPSAPDEESIFDDMPLVFEHRVPKTEFEHQQRIARVLYERLIGGLRWRSALTSEFAGLIAAYDDERGLRTFAAGTRSDGTHAHLWR